MSRAKYFPCLNIKCNQVASAGFLEVMLKLKEFSSPLHKVEVVSFNSLLNFSQYNKLKKKTLI